MTCWEVGCPKCYPGDFSPSDPEAAYVAGFNAALEEAAKIATHPAFDYDAVAIRKLRRRLPGRAA